MNDINNLDIRTHIIDAIVDVFDTMVSMQIEFSDSKPPDTTGTGRMAATVNFAGNVVGFLTIQVPAEMSRLMMAAMLDSDPEENEDEGKIRDLIAEISNIVGANLKTALNGDGHQCVISTPSITYGTDFTIKSLQMERFERFIFTHQENYIFVEVGLKPEQAACVGGELGPTDTHAPNSNADDVKIDVLDLNARVSEAVIDVFDTLLSLKLEPADAASVESLEGIRTVGSVSFAGDANGMVSIHAGDGFSRQMAAEMLGMEVEEIEGDEEIRNMLGEMGNIVGRNLRSVFTDAGFMCALSTPSFTSGSDFKVDALNMEKYERLAFRCGKNVIFVELGVKASELVQADTTPAKDLRALDDDTTQPDPPAQSQEVEAQDPATATTASDLTTPEQPDLSAKPDLAKAAEQEQSQISEKSDRPGPAEPEQPSVQARKNGSAETQAAKIPEDLDLDLLLDIPLELKVELGRARIKIHKLLKLAPGSAVKLIKLEGDPVDILVNSTLIARGEVVVQNEKYGIRVTEITSRMDRIRSFGI
jgi:flagellar motor switch protein FliN